MYEIHFTCPDCGKEHWIATAKNMAFCGKGVCCKCCKGQGIQSKYCRMEQLAQKRFAQGKDRLNKNHMKGLLMEKAVSDALFALGIPHDSNPFDNTYSEANAIVDYMTSKGISRRLAKCLAQGMLFSPDKRFADAAAFKAALSSSDGYPMKQAEGLSKK